MTSSPRLLCGLAASAAMVASLAQAAPPSSLPPGLYVGTFKYTGTCLTGSYQYPARLAVDTYGNTSIEGIIVFPPGNPTLKYYVTELNIDGTYKEIGLAPNSNGAVDSGTWTGVAASVGPVVKRFTFTQDQSSGCSVTASGAFAASPPGL